MSELSVKELLRKATLTSTNDGGTPTGDFGGLDQAPLSVEQIAEFYRVALTPQAMLSEVAHKFNRGAIWQESKIDFTGEVLRPGTQATRLAEGDRYSPTTDKIEMITSLVRAEVPISDEALEDQVEQEDFASTITNLLAQAVGRDLERMMINGDRTGSGNALSRLLNGWFTLAEDSSDGHVYDATAESQDYQAVFRNLLTSIPSAFKGNLDGFRYYVPQILLEKYRDTLSERGTNLGDLTLQGRQDLHYQGIMIKAVPLLNTVDGSPDTSKVLLAHPMNLYAGFQRQLRMEMWRDPREGATSFVMNARVATAIAHVPATAIATNVNVEPS